jgi:hypothetical protein
MVKDSIDDILEEGWYALFLCYKIYILY